MDNTQTPGSIILSMMGSIFGIIYSFFSEISSQKFSNGLDITIKILTIVSICVVVYWHLLQIIKHKKEAKKDKETTNGRL